MIKITTLLAAIVAAMAAGADPVPIRFGAAKTNDTFYAASDIKALAFADAETDPTIYSWAKAATKPSYTASEVGALPTSGSTVKIYYWDFGINDSLSFKFMDAVMTPYIQVFGMYDLYFPMASGTLALTSDIPTVPTNVSAFTNDAGYLTSYTESDPEAASIASNVVTQAFIQERLGVYLYIGQDGGIYVHTGE